MYNRVKYLLYVSIFLFFIIFFTAIQQKSSMIEEQKIQQQIEQDMIKKAEKYRKIADERNKLNVQMHEEPVQTDTFTPIVTEPRIPVQTQQTNYTENQRVKQETEYSTNSKHPTKEILYFISDNTEAAGYILCKRFKFDGNNYAIVAYDDTRYASEYSQYINRKFYIYKESEQKLVGIHYLFEKSVKKDDKATPDFSVIENSYDVKITYNEKPPVTRTVSRNILINSTRQYNTPALTTSISDSTGTTENSKKQEDTNNTNTPDAEMNQIPNLPEY